MKRDKSTYIAFLDIEKAFDSVSHHSIMRTAKRQGVPEHLLSYLRNAYDNCSTILNSVPDSPIQMTRGVKQGDPLSPILFNAVIDDIISAIPTNIGLQQNNAQFNIMAFADDLCVMTSSAAGLQAVLDHLAKEAAFVGLKFNPLKSVTISKQTRNRKVVITSKTFTINKELIPSLKPEDRVRYLGALVSPTGKLIGNTKEIVEKGIKN